MIPVEVASFKLRLVDRHVRVLPDVDDAGRPFAGPGVDLRGEDAERVIALSRPLIAALEKMEPGVVVRSIAVDRRRPRITATLAPTTRGEGPRARVVRVDGGFLLETLIALAEGALPTLVLLARQALDRRPSATMPDQKT